MSEPRKRPDRYRAKRFGWNEEDDDPDRTPTSELYESMDLEGELMTFEFRVPGSDVIHTAYLVGGQEADPATVERVG